MASSTSFHEAAEKLTQVSPTTTSGILLHPLVVMNVSNHWTRSKSLSQKKVVGVLLGQVNNSYLEIVASFELPPLMTSHNEEDVGSIDTQSSRNQRDRIIQVFQGIDVVGWYTCGSRLTPDDIALHRKVIDCFECTTTQFVLLMDPSPSSASNSLPVYIFEPRSSSVPEATTTKCVTEFECVSFAIRSDEIENIGVDAAINAESQHNASSSAAPTATRGKKAIAVLRDSIDVALNFLTAVSDGIIPIDSTTYDLMMRISAVCSSLKNDGRDEFLDGAKEREYLNTLLVTYLGTLSRADQTLQQLSDNSSICFSDKMRR